MVAAFSVPNLQTAQWSINGNKMKGHRGEAREISEQLASIKVQFNFTATKLAN
jgi:hypothetical protein